jgi:OPA family sugar phosphate sensor protein UhpC-like MFS transporter
MKRIISFFKTKPDIPLINNDKTTIRRIYEQKRWSVFLSLTFGYGMFYICRINFSVAKKSMLDAGIMDTKQMGIAGSILLIVYAFGKMFNGVLSDHSNIRRLMSVALLGSALTNLVLGSLTMFIVFAILWGLNGWFQSIGSAPSIVSLSYWFSNRERGTRYGIWSVSHSIGEAMTFFITSFLVATLSWRWGFWGPGLICVIAAIVLSRTLQDRPQCYGLPPISEYKNDKEKTYLRTESTLRLQLEVLKNPIVWILGLSNATLYVVRYAINNWAILYLQLGKGYSLIEAGSVLSVYPIAGLVGSISCGIISDRFFNSKRNVPVLLFGLIEIFALVAFYMVPSDHKLLDIISLIVFGFGLGGLVVFLGGLMAVDICPQKAAGIASGIVGMFGYIGAAIQDVTSGYIINASKTIVGNTTTYSFDSVFMFWIGSGVVSLLLVSMLWKIKSNDRS